MSNSDLMQRLRITFVQELDEHVRALNSALLAFESDPHDAEPIRALFRSAHTIKGAARVSGITVVEEACHALESLFAAVRDQRRELDGSTFSLMFAVVDALADAGTRIRTGETLDSSPLQSLMPRLLAIEGTEDVSRTEAVPAETAATADALDTLELDAVDTAASAATARPHSEASDGLVRVRADRLDALLDAVGELVMATGRMVERSARHDPDARRLDQVTDELADVVHRLRLRPFSDVCESLPRTVRDIAESQHRDVALDLRGQDVEADRQIIDALRDPLMHLVRNAVDHGIEPPDVRERKGKPRTGHVRVAAELTGGRLVVTVADDGGGLDEDAIRAALRDRGRAVPRSRDELADALLEGAFSTRAAATTFSGRGVGVDVARTTIERIGGTIDVDWIPGRGTTFTLECPPTRSAMRALLVRVGTYLFAIPTPNVERIRRFEAADLQDVEGRRIISTPTGPIHVHSLAALLGPPFEARPLDRSGLLVIVVAGARRSGLVVDDVTAEEEIFVRPLDVDSDDVVYASGATILPSGQVALVLGTAALIAGAVRSGTGIAPLFAGSREKPRRRVLVADDSITTRVLEQSVLEAAGFDVITAVNGEDAWQRLQEQPVDAVVADVEMPRMDGFALCRRIRSSPLSRLPIVLVTGLASEADRARGMEAGADAYIIKSGFDQENLLSILNQLIGDQ